ncbi:hypothetical protein [Luteimonas saliphila]|uniref:hypothetical protein n=1 Tax=Luteimonas saliphila TaxID=2804919 RepID=UPI00192E2BE1|nr:hypothetical protein [Luteimonas saliphila]
MSARPGEQRRISPLGLACAAAVAFAPAVHAADEEASAPGTGRQRAFQDHIAYVATFAMPVLIEKCAADEPDYLPRAAPAYFRFVNARQDAIERGRLLTLAELAPDDTLQDYRTRTVASRLGVLDSGTPEEKHRTCAGALAMLVGEHAPQGEWPTD